MGLFFSREPLQGEKEPHMGAEDGLALEFTNESIWDNRELVMESVNRDMLQNLPLRLVVVIKKM